MTTTVIGSDILDIGTRKGRRQREDPFFVAAPAALTLGTPGQFDLPNVPDVRQLLHCSVPSAATSIATATAIAWAIVLHW
jgi:hypothetical protein